MRNGKIEERGRKAPLQPGRTLKEKRVDNSLGAHLLAKILECAFWPKLRHLYRRPQSQHISIEKSLDAPLTIMSAPQMVQCFGKKKTATAVAHCKVRAPTRP